MGDRAECEWGELLMANYIATDTDLTALADAIRTKGGTSGQLVFPQGFVDAIDAIETGGEDYMEARITGALTSYSNESVTSIVNNAFREATALKYLWLPNVTRCGPTHPFYNTAIENLALPSVVTSGMNNFTFQGMTKLQKLDFTDAGALPQNLFAGATALNTLVLRNPSLVSLWNANAFAQTQFKSGGTGGTLYVPQALIADYQAATNWSTILSYENNQILPIEGSIYETQYVDGHPLLTT